MSTHNVKTDHHIYEVSTGRWRGGRYLTDDEFTAYLATRPQYGEGPPPTQYHIYINGVYSHDWLNGEGYLQTYLFLDGRTGWTTGPEYIPPPATKWTLEDFYLPAPPEAFQNALDEQADISASFTGRENPLKHNEFFRAGDWRADRKDVREYSIGENVHVNSVRKVTSGYETENETSIYYESTQAHLTATSTSPVDGANSYWRVLEIWDGNGINLARGSTNCSLYRETKAIDPESFKLDFEFQYNRSTQHGFSVFAGTNNPDPSESDAAFTMGMNMFVLTSWPNNIQFHIKKANGTSQDIGGALGWTAFGEARTGVGSFENKHLTIPYTNLSVGSDLPTIKVRIIHHQGLLTLYFNSVKSGEFEYQRDVYPFRRSTAGHPANAGRRISAGDRLLSRGVHFGVLGGGQSEAATPSHVLMKKICFSKIEADDLL